MNRLNEIRDVFENLAITKKVGGGRMLRIIAVVFAVFVLLIAVSIFRKGDTVIQTRWARVERGRFIVDLVESGDIEAYRQVEISAPMMWGAQLQVIDLVEEGTIVEEGDIILQFDTSDLEEQKKLREDQLESLHADMEKLLAQQALTISNMENSLRLAEYSTDQAKLRLEMREFESQARKEEARLELKQAEIQLNKVKKQLESQKVIHNSQIVKMEMSIREAQNRIRNSSERIERLILRAPVDGMVVYQQVMGERVKEGYEPRPGWPLMSIPDLSRMQVKLFANEVDRLKIRPGQRAIIRMDAYPESEFRGTVREVARLAQLVTGAELLKGFVVYVDIEGIDPKLKPGMSAEVHIALEEYEDVIKVPIGAVFEYEGRSVVFPRGKTKPLEVSLGQRNDGFAIVEQGLSEGMQLSWKIPEEAADIYGTVEEKRRIAEINRMIQESFDVFEQRGILYDYGVALSSAAPGADSEKPGLDLDDLPASIRERLQQGRNTENPALKVESVESGGGRDEGTFRVSSDMMERLRQRGRSEESEKDESQEKK